MYMTGTEFMQKNLSGSRLQLYNKLRRGVFQSDNESCIETESLKYQTLAQVEKVQNP